MEITPVKLGAIYRIHPSHWPKGQFANYEVIEIDSDDQIGTKYARVREIARPYLDFLIPIANLEKMEPIQPSGAHWPLKE